MNAVPHIGRTLGQRLPVNQYADLQAQADADAAARELLRSYEIDTQLQADALLDRAGCDEDQQPMGFVTYFHEALGPFWPLLLAGFGIYCALGIAAGIAWAWAWMVQP